MTVALHGNLRDFGIAEVFQLIGHQRKTGTLVVEGEPFAIALAFDGGRVVRGGPAGSANDSAPLGPQLVRSGYLTQAQLDDLCRESERSARRLPDLLLAAGLIDPGTLDDVRYLMTRETVFDVMRRKSGDFQFTAEAVVHDTPPEHLLGAEQILMDGLRMLDEWQTFCDIVPSQDMVFRRVGNLATARALTRGESDTRLGHAERVLQLVDGRLSVRRIVDLSRIGTFEATRALAELRQAGVIDVAATLPKRARPGRPVVRRPPIGRMLRVAFATIVPLAALAGLAFLTFERADATGGLPGAAIPPRSIDQLGGRYATQRLREQLEVHYFETGAYPELLQALAASEVGRRAALDGSRLDGYYYRTREDEVVLLAPIR
jgi:hypothetical protein